MRKFVFTTLFITFFLFNAQVAKAETDVVGTVGNFYLNLSGYVSPYASIALTSEKVFMRSTVADSKGDFFFTQVLIKEGFSSFCLDAVDFHRLGDSYTCFEIPPAEASVTKDNIFLPPTLALSRNSIGPNQSADAFGYTMPKARVILYLSNGETFEVKADSKGYYTFKIEKLAPGRYQIYARAVLGDEESLAPSKKQELESLSYAQQIGGGIIDLLKKLLTGLFNLLLTYIWIALPVFILLIILLSKPFKDFIRRILKRAPTQTVPAKYYVHLHHYWFFGY